MSAAAIADLEALAEEMRAATSRAEMKMEPRRNEDFEEMDRVLGLTLSWADRIGTSSEKEGA